MFASVFAAGSLDFLQTFSPVGLPVFTLLVGLEIGGIAPRLFTIMVLMTLATTFLAIPVVNAREG